MRVRAIEKCLAKKAAEEVPVRDAVVPQAVADFDTVVFISQRIRCSFGFLYGFGFAYQKW